MPLEREVVAEGEAVEEWKERMERHHELGYRHPFGCFPTLLAAGSSGRSQWHSFSGFCHSVKDSILGPWLSAGFLFR